MTIRIDKDMTIKQVQQLFSEMFPFLKIEFFRKHHADYEASHRKDLRKPSEPVWSKEVPEVPVIIEIDSQLKVKELEQAFRSRAGLAAQVFRKSGTVWIETSLTDDWTLGQQNHEGELLSRPMNRTAIDSPDNI